LHLDTLPSERVVDMKTCGKRAYKQWSIFAFSSHQHRDFNPVDQGRRTIVLERQRREM
jgi:hypothetical protein